MSDFIKNDEMIKSLLKDEIFDMWESTTLENFKLKEKIRYLENELTSERKELHKKNELHKAYKRTHKND